jgi:hypothetical protein
MSGSGQEKETTMSELQSPFRSAAETLNSEYNLGRRAARAIKWLWGWSRFAFDGILILVSAGLLIEYQDVELQLDSWRRTAMETRDQLSTARHTLASVAEGREADAQEFKNTLNAWQRKCDGLRQQTLQEFQIVLNRMQNDKEALASSGTELGR